MPKLETIPYLLIKYSHFTRLLSSQYREVLFVCTSNLMHHCVVTGVKVPPSGEIITAAQTPNCSHFTHMSGLFKHNCRHQASAIVHCLAKFLTLGLSIAHSSPLKRLSNWQVHSKIKASKVPTSW